MDIQDQFFACGGCDRKIHLDCNHYLGFGECSYNNCNCIRFNQSRFSIEIEITKADIFEVETNTREERYSIIWWELFRIWLESREKKDADYLQSVYSFGERNLFPGFSRK